MDTIARPTPINRAGSPDGYDSQWETVEEVAVTLLSDLRNELVARWLQVTVKMELPSLERVGRQGITMEDRQPNWSNDALLDRLPPV